MHINNTLIRSDRAILRQKTENLHKKNPAKKSPQLSEMQALKLIHELEVHQIELELQNEELKSARNLAREAVDKYTELLDFAPSGYFILSRDGEIIGINLNGANMLGKERSLFKKGWFAFFVSKNTRPIFNLFLANLFESRTSETCDITISSKGNPPKDLCLTGIVNKNGDQCLVTGIDITERKQAEAELREKEVQYHNLADSGLALIWTSDTNKLRNYFNKPWLEFRGLTLEQETGNGWTEGIHPDDANRYLKIYNDAFVFQESFDSEFRLRHSSGEYRRIYDTGTPNYNSNGVFIGFIGHCFDITRHNNIEETLKNEELRIARAAARDASDKYNQLNDLHERVILHLVQSGKKLI
jgi:PAS domain S-box-containing protein